MGCPPALFVAASNDKRDWDAQKAESDKFANFIDAVSTAVAGAWAYMQGIAILTGIAVNGQTSVGGTWAVGGPRGGAQHLSPADRATGLE